MHTATRLERELLTPRQVAQVLELSRSRVYQLLGAGDIRSVKVGASRRIPRACLTDYIDTLIADAS
jgi:excisionase family DNA binding protein